MTNCIVRSYANASADKDLKEKLSLGWVVKFANPIQGQNGNTICIEYVLEKKEGID